MSIVSIRTHIGIRQLTLQRQPMKVMVVITKYLCVTRRIIHKLPQSNTNNFILYTNFRKSIEPMSPTQPIEHCITLGIIS